MSDLCKATDNTYTERQIIEFEINLLEVRKVFDLIETKMEGSKAYTLNLG